MGKKDAAKKVRGKINQFCMACKKPQTAARTSSPMQRSMHRFEFLTSFK
jgi:hypothetical protein